MLFAALLSAAAVLAGVYQHNHIARGEQIRVQGVALVRLLSSMTLPQVAPANGSRSALDLLSPMHSEGGFAYAQITDRDGRALREVTAPGVFPPEAVPAGRQPDGWFGERQLVDGEGRVLREYFAPMLDGAVRIATVRVGFYAPGMSVMLDEGPTIAAMALPVLLLAPLSFLLIRREVRPLRGLREALDRGVQSVELTASGEIGEFVRSFNHFASDARRRLEDLGAESDRQRAAVSVLGYHKARMESVLEAMPEAVVVMDESGAVSFASRKLTTMVGLDAGKLVGHRPMDWCEEPSLREFLLSCSRRVVRGNEAARLEITPSHLPDRRLSVSAFPLFSPRGGNDVFGTLVAFQDVTQEALARQARQDFVAQLSHELKTPLQVISMYAETLLEDAEIARATQIEAGNVIHDEVERVNALINNLLSIARIEAGAVNLNRRMTRLGDLVADVFATAERGAPEGMRMRLDVAPDLPTVNIDKDLMRVALNNLLSNAVKYNRPDGEVLVGAEENAECIRVYVRDTGIGIAPEDQAAVFRRFVRVQSAETESRAGHGLGLALSHDIVELHHGRLVLESTPGEGSEFSILLPKTPLLLREGT